MIINCFNCNKKFDIDANLIPDAGRLVQCSSCSYKWFFKNEIDINLDEVSVDNIINKTDNLIKKIENNQSFETENVPLNVEPYKRTEDKKLDTITDKSLIEELPKKIVGNTVETLGNLKKKKPFKLLNLTIVFLISFVAFIILVDTFKTPLSKIIPNIEFILYNLFETITDIKLFFKDLK